MQAEVGAIEPASVATTSWGTPSLDLGAGVARPAGARGRHRRRPGPLHPRVAGPLLLPARRPLGRPAGRPDPARTPTGAHVSDRRDQVAANLEAVRGRIASACREAGRDPDEVRLVVVTKFFPASDVRLLADLGVTDVGENRHQEAEEKAAECADLGLRWHFIGGLQSNKAAAVARYADVVESVDRVKLVRRLNEGAHERSHPVDCLLQVSLDPPGRRGEGRGGSGRSPRAGVGSPGRRDAHPAWADGRRAARRGPGRGVRATGRRSVASSSPNTPTPPGCRPG